MKSIAPSPYESPILKRTEVREPPGGGRLGAAGSSTEAALVSWVSAGAEETACTTNLSGLSLSLRRRGGLPRVLQTLLCPQAVLCKMSSPCRGRCAASARPRAVRLPCRPSLPFPSQDLTTAQSQQPQASPPMRPPKTTSDSQSEAAIYRPQALSSVGLDCPRSHPSKPDLTPAGS